MPEEKEIPFTINGRTVQAEPGESVLSVARRLGVAIPTLCHHAAVLPSGACRLCVVEVFWGKRSKMVTSCLYTPYENDRVETDNERVHKARRLVLELLAARCPGVQQIRDLAREYGVNTPRFETAENARRERCILCGLCVRVCAEVVGQHAIGYGSRGMERRIVAPFAEQADECIGCAACVYVCPTGALHFEDVNGARVMKEMNTTVPMVACRECGRPFATAKQIEKVKGRLEHSSDMVDLCPSCRTHVFGGRVFGKGLARASSASLSQSVNSYGIDASPNGSEPIPRHR